jgi:hypothetical protein
VSEGALPVATALLGMTVAPWSADAGSKRRAPLHRGFHLAEDQDPPPREAGHLPRRLGAQLLDDHDE